MRLPGELRDVAQFGHHLFVIGRPVTAVTSRRGWGRPGIIVPDPLFQRL
ncbi:hypothetical protein [Streptosporangium sp. 'caverna']|nr:hypothetical protein [Streptosporangium sp. 'caverna']